jgi:hypothetical protein
MDTALQTVAVALAELDDGTLAALIAAKDKAPHIAPGSLAWIKGAPEGPLTVADQDRPELAEFRS